MLAVISPSKTQDFGEIGITKFSLTRQIDESVCLINILKTKSMDEISNLMSISDNLSSLNYERFQNFHLPFSLDNSKQALFAFKGDVYSGIDAGCLTTDDLSFAQDNLRILSGLYGVIRPLDLIQGYRLEMSTKLANAKGNNLYHFWGDKISKVLNSDESDVIINLASNEYFKGIDKKSLDAKIINITFKEYKVDKYKIVGIYAKRARGAMVNFIITNRLTNPESLKLFDVGGYVFRDEFSDESNFIFTRGNST